MEPCEFNAITRPFTKQQMTACSKCDNQHSTYKRKRYVANPTLAQIGMSHEV